MEKKSSIEGYNIKKSINLLFKDIIVIGIALSPLFIILLLLLIVNPMEIWWFNGGLVAMLLLDEIFNPLHQWVHEI